jgi:hypothetical protein
MFIIKGLFIFIQILNRFYPVLHVYVLLIGRDFHAAGFNIRSPEKKVEPISATVFIKSE